MDKQIAGFKSLAQTVDSWGHAAAVFMISGASSKLGLAYCTYLSTS